MVPLDATQWLSQAAEQFNRHAHRKDGGRVAECLANGLSVLRDALYLRVHRDVETAVGRDSMLMPLSEMKTLQAASGEIEVYQVAESTVAVAQFQYVGPAEDWYLPWLAELKLGERGTDPGVRARLRAYLGETPDARRLTFADHLARILPESTWAPLVLFRMVPLSVHVTTATAFGDPATASKLRRQQADILPAITSCHTCRGRVLKCTEQCRACGNPLWKNEWLAALD